MKCPECGGKMKLISRCRGLVNLVGEGITEIYRCAKCNYKVTIRHNVWKCEVKDERINRQTSFTRLTQFNSWLITLVCLLRVANPKIPSS